MTKEMMSEIIADLKKKVKTLYIVIAILIAALIGMTVFAFSTFEFTHTEETTYAIEQHTDAGDNVQQSVQIPNDKDNNMTYFIVGLGICAVVIAGIAGVVVHGKNVSKNNNKEKKDDKDS